MADKKISQLTTLTGVNVDDVKHAWLKSDKASLFVKNPNFQLAKQNVFVERLIKELDNHSPIYKKIKRKKNNGQ